ncbi:hypothetical protein F5Y01DRAFT_328390 [Xylaria sp. FL0043]|nr:hypothetical protein F5Y01DRAFT_328390 [Xylaria sp. FL0043]
MAPETVGNVIAAIADSYATALECHTGWRRRQSAHNHYQKKKSETTSNDNGADEGAKSARMTYDAVSASLTFSKMRIEEAFRGGADVLGDEFVSGDCKTLVSSSHTHHHTLRQIIFISLSVAWADTGFDISLNAAVCRDVLLENLAHLRDCVAVLEQAVKPAEYRPLPLAEITRVSEAVRIACLDALHKQYQRMVVGRLAPREHNSSRASAPELARAIGEESHVEGTGDEAGINDTPPAHNRTSLEKRHRNNHQHHHSNSNNNSSNSNNSSSNYEPPSPPPTPTKPSTAATVATRLMKPERNADTDVDAVSTYSWSTAAGSSSENARPKNSVFSVFCPEAMKYQVDLEKALPVDGARCRCGYVWDASWRGQDRTAMVIKDGFQITPRFLGKSHCDKGLGCVLCTSSGKTETFGSVEGLKTHINSSHTKWQLLHDRDLAGALKG